MKETILPLINYFKSSCWEARLLFEKEQVEPSFLFPLQKAAVVSHSPNTIPVFTHCCGREAAVASSGSLALSLFLFSTGTLYKYCQTLNNRFFTSTTRVILFIWCISKASSNKKRKIPSTPASSFLSSCLPSAEPCASSSADDCDH